MEAIRHAQAARDWGLAARLLADHWPGLYLDGQAATVHELLAGFPAEARAADAELAAVAAADELASGSLEAAERYLGLAERGSASVPDGRRGQAQLLLGVVRLLLARQRGNLPAVAEEAQRLQAMAEAPEAAQPGLGEELRALALISLGSTEFWAARFEEAERHLEQGVALARRIGRPYLEFTGLAYQAAVEIFRSFARAAERSRQAIELAERHGWTDEPAAGIAYVILGAVLAWQGRPEEAEPWVQRAERTLRAEAEPAAGLAVRYVRGLLELARGRDADALAAFQAAERLAGRLAAPHLLVPPDAGTAGARPGAPRRDRARRAGPRRPRRPGPRPRGDAHRRRRCCGSPRTTRTRRSPRSRRSWTAPLRYPGRAWLAQAFLLEAIARDALGDPAAAGRALERALDLAEPDGALLWFLLHPAPGLLRAPRPAPHRPRRPDRRDPQPARRAHARPAARRAAAAAGAAERQRDPGAALPADQPVGAGDRRRAVRLAQHRQDPHAPPVRQARHAQPGRGRRPRPRPRPARALPAAGPGHASWLTAGAGRSGRRGFRASRRVR